jgi:hypothetical protein
VAHGDSGQRTGSLSDDIRFDEHEGYLSAARLRKKKILYVVDPHGETHRYGVSNATTTLMLPQKNRPTTTKNGLFF